MVYFLGGFHISSYDIIFSNQKVGEFDCYLLYCLWRFLNKETPHVYAGRSPIFLGLILTKALRDLVHMVTRNITSNPLVPLVRVARTVRGRAKPTNGKIINYNYFK